MRRPLSIIAHLLGGLIKENRIRIKVKLFVNKYLKHHAKITTFFNNKCKHHTKFSETFNNTYEHHANIIILPIRFNYLTNFF
jgi:hypothetical protein